MKRLSAILVLAACFSSVALAQAPGPGPGGKPAPGPGTGPSQGTPAEFVLTVCNKSRELALAAVGSRIPQRGGGEHATHVQGWWKAPAGECTTIGTFPDPAFLIHLRTPGGLTAPFKDQPTVPLCVNVKGDFTATVASSMQGAKLCRSGQTLVAFHMFVVGQAKTYTLTLNP